MQRFFLLTGFVSALLFQSTARAEPDKYNVTVTLKSLKCISISRAEPGSSGEFYGYASVGFSTLWRTTEKSYLSLRAGQTRSLNKSTSFALSPSRFKGRSLSLRGALYESDTASKRDDLGSKSTTYSLDRGTTRSLKMRFEKNGDCLDMFFDVVITPPVDYAELFGQWQMDKIGLSFTKKGRWLMGNSEDANNNYSGAFKYIGKSGNIIKMDLPIDTGSSKGHTVKAIFRRSGNNLEYCGSYKARPTQFKQGGGNVYWIFKLRR